MGKRHVHVVAPQQQMFADSFSAEREILFDFDDCQICSTTTDINDEHGIADGNLLFPIILIGCKPCVEGGQRLFDQR